MPALLVTFAAIVAGTFVSEDLTTIATGLLTADGRMPLWLGVSACALGIWAGDVGLWLIGRFASASLAQRLGRRAPPAGLVNLRNRLARRPGLTIMASRFLPGTRLPLYVSASALGISFGAFALWSAMAVTIWAPLLVLTITRFGHAAIPPLRAYLGAGWIVAPVVLGLAWHTHRVRRDGGDHSVAEVSVLDRIRRWEFWPSWIFYAPVVPRVAWLALRHGLRALTAANPGIEDGGLVGESKAAILAKLPAEWTLAARLIEPAAPIRRLLELHRWSPDAGRRYPLILKPDVGQRGVGVKLVRSDDEALQYFAAQPVAVLAQVYHPGPYEAGIFYYRFPGQARGRIFSITDKRFPIVVGDGVSTLGTLIRRHDRYRFQAPKFLERHRSRLSSVPRAGAPVRLGIVGNHAQGTLFLDGSSLETAALASRLDDIARRIDGFYIGRFDVRYTDPRGLMAGDDLAIVELNGVSAEATHIYDPSSTLLAAYRTLYQQWSLVFRIGAANVRRGSPATPLKRLVRLCIAHLTTKPALTAAD
jgi:membrane protein DedA with SNARE-associated domain